MTGLCTGVRRSETHARMKSGQGRTMLSVAPPTSGENRISACSDSAATVRRAVSGTVTRKDGEWVK
eukprot:3272673-Prymnesium_polylepis.2